MNSSPEHKEHLKRNAKSLAKSLKGCPRVEGSGRPSIPIEVLDTLNGEITVYPSISETARAIWVSQSSISKAFKCKDAGSSEATTTI